MQSKYILKLICKSHIQYYIIDKKSFFYSNLNDIFQKIVLNDIWL